MESVVLNPDVCAGLIRVNLIYTVIAYLVILLIFGIPLYLVRTPREI